MPAKFDLSWDDVGRRWRVMQDGKRFVVSCRQLGKQGYLDANAAHTKTATYQAANRWWSDKLKEIGQAPPPPHPQAERLAELERRADWARRHDEPTGAIDDEIRTTTSIEERDDDPAPLDHPGRDYLASLAQFGIVVAEDADPTAVAMVLGKRRVWADRAKRDQAEVPPADRQVKANGESYISLIESRYRSGLLSPSEFDLVRRAVRSFTGWVGEKVDVGTITPPRWQAWYQQVLGSECSVSWKQKQWRHSREFVIHLAEMGLVSLPPNLSSRKYRFGDGEVAAIPTFSVDECKTVLAGATGRLRLVILLCLNCGFTQKDVADLHQDEVDWTNGRIVRSRSKTRKQTGRNALIVCYPLWPRTFELLKEYRGSSEIAFPNEKGVAWVRRDENSRSDGVMSCWRHLQTKTGISGPPKLLRKTGASLLKNSGTYSDLDWLYLGDKPRSIPDKHYSARSQERFDEAIRWLGSQFGM